MQYLQAELRTVNETLATKQQEAVHTLQENARLLGDLSRAQGDLHRIQEEVRGLRPLKDELGFAQRRTEELGRRLVEQDAAVQQLSTSNEQLQAKRRASRSTSCSRQSSGWNWRWRRRMPPSRRKSRSWPACWSDSVRRRLVQIG